MWLYLLINEQAGNGNGKRVSREVTQYLDEQDISYEAIYTAYPFHERILIHELLEEKKLVSWPQKEEGKPFPLLIVVGGEGTLHEIINTIQDPTIPIAYIPVIKNEFTKNCGITTSPKKRIQQILATKEPIAMHTLYYQEQVSQASGICFSHLGIGLSAEIEKNVQERRRNQLFKIHPFYLMPKFYTIMKNVAFHNGFPICLEYQGRKWNFPHTLLCSVVNSKHFFSIEEENLEENTKIESEFMIVEKQSWLHLIRIAFSLWRHRPQNSPLIFTGESKQIHIISTVPQYIHFDGQIWNPQPIDLYLTPSYQYFWEAKNSKEK